MNGNVLLKIGLFLFVLNFIPVLNASEQSTMKFSHIAESEGLPAAYIGNLYQDTQGFIWIGTFHSAIYRYDGVNIETFRNDPTDPSSMPAVFYGKMHQDEGNILWIATSRGLVALDLNTEKVTHYTHDPRDPSSISPGNISGIYEDPDGQIWLGTSTDGLCAFNKDTGKFLHYRNDPEDPGGLASNEIFSIGADNTGTLWICTSAGLNQYNKETGSFVLYRHDPGDPGSLSSDMVYSMTRDRSGTLWFATGNGVNALEPGKEKFRRYYFTDPGTVSPVTPSRIYAGPVSDRIWTPVFGDGLYELDRETEKFIFISRYDPEDSDSLATNEIYTILEDKSGMLWIGGGGGFLNAAKLKNKEFHSMPDDPLNPEGFHGMMARDYAEDDSGLIWVASHGGGLQVFDRKQDKILRRYTYNEQNPGSLPSNDTFSVLIDDSGSVWVGHRKGISRLDRGSEKFVHYYSDMLEGDMRLLQDSRGEIWAAGWFGLSRFNRYLERFLPFVPDPGNPKNVLLDLYEDSSGNLLVGTRGKGVMQIQGKTKEVTYITNDPAEPGGPGHDGVYALFEDSKANLWVATTMGLNRYDKDTGEFTRFTRNDGLGSNTVYELLEDDHGNLWIITNVGLSKYDPAKNTFQNYNDSDGITGKNHYGKALKSRDGFIYFPGNGINYFNPVKITDNEYLPPVVITEMKLFNRKVPVGEFEPGRTILTKHISKTGELELSYSDHIISFKFSALSFVNTSKNQYAYIMEGFEKDWNYCGTRNFVTYTNLDAGNYTLRIKAANDDGKWNDEGVSLKIKVRPSFWHAWWFRTAVIVLLSGIFAVIFLYLNRRFKAKQKARMIKHEIDLVRNIRSSLLPDLSVVSDAGYELAANMNFDKPAGGCYYDVLRGKDGRLWLVTGYVAGHGISAGLSTMMAQISIHNLLGNISGITPCDLLARVNRKLTSYIRNKMKSDQRMILSFLVEKYPGYFQYAGRYKAILVHKANTGEILRPDAAGGGSQKSDYGQRGFRLDRNDTTLWYTCGLPGMRNTRQQEINIKRLMELMKSNCESPEALKRAINNSVNNLGGIRKDEINYLICRRK